MGKLEINKGVYMKAVLISLLVFSSSLVLAKEQRDFAFAEGKKIVLENSSGNVSVHTTEGSTVKVSFDKVKFGKNCQLNMEQSKVEIKIISKKIDENSWSSKDCKVNFVIFTPKTINFDLKNGRGQITIENLLGDITIKNGQGDITISKAQGNLELKTGRGDLIIDSSSKNVDIASGSGDLVLKGKVDSLIGRSGKGDVHIEGEFADVDLRLGLGDVEAKLPLKKDSKAKFDVRTGMGDILLNLPKESNVQTSFSSGFGSLKNELRNSSSRGASIDVDAKTGKGDLIIKTL
jgi:DUF4097 and DUF4098 domain-containing protein YvlB